ncbi:hypothetical protein B0H14DRAFT_3459726 [Mycena olivaceomarginata]|nr:hypothetical protein B0H14DRAFT_3459726 [Mycena olivaceomarginata]
MPDMVNSYICYCTEQATAGGPLCTLLNEEDLTVQEVYEIQVVDIFETFTTDMKLKPTETSIAPTLVREGLLPCTPWAPSVVITARMLETYRIQHGEDKLIFDMLTTMDGNNPLKHMPRWDKASMVENEGGEPVFGKSNERVDNRDTSITYGGGEFVNNPYAGRWKNMIDDVTSKMCGIFDEMGIFLALYRHGFVLVITDMIRSSELVKYPLEIVQELLDTFRMNLSAGYDVGCHFGVTTQNSSFHGHAHNRLCQLSFLTMYIEGMGLKDLEGCERYFSQSNRLVKSCRYASRFHHQQEIMTYTKHFDSFKTYANILASDLGKFPCTNFCQALGILNVGERCAPN